MNAKEFAAELLETIADAIPDDVTVDQGLLDNVSELIAKFMEPKVPIIKTDAAQRMAWGWASVISKNGQMIIDRQGDVVEVADLREAVYDFMKHRTAGDMHGQLGVGEVVESIILDAELQKSLGIDLGMEGWYVGVHIPNDAVWEKVQNGDYKAFSIGGSANRVEMSADDAAGCVVVKGGANYKAINDGTPSEKTGTCKACGKKAKSCGCGVKKFNENHGSDGRFSSGVGGGGGGSKVGGGSAAPKGKKRSMQQLQADYDVARNAYKLGKDKDKLRANMDSIKEMIDASAASIRRKKK